MSDYYKKYLKYKQKYIEAKNMRGGDADALLRKLQKYHDDRYTETDAAAFVEEIKNLVEPILDNIAQIFLQSKDKYTYSEPPTEYFITGTKHNIRWKPSDWNNFTIAWLYCQEKNDKFNTNSPFGKCYFDEIVGRLSSYYTKINQSREENVIKTFFEKNKVKIIEAIEQSYENYKINIMENYNIKGKNIFKRQELTQDPNHQYRELLMPDYSKILYFQNIPDVNYDKMIIEKFDGDKFIDTKKRILTSSDNTILNDPEQGSSLFYDTKNGDVFIYVNDEFVPTGYNVAEWYEHLGVQ
jgi:hypothetical protein